MNNRLVPTSVALGALVLTMIGAGPPTTASSATPTCQGRQATIVGVPGARLRGTEGADVIVTAGARGVQALGGDDLVCVTKMRKLTAVRVGAGDDSVVVGTGGYSRIEVSLGAGDDRFVGGSGRDSVDSVSSALGGDAQNAGADVIRTRGGDDSVTVGTTSLPADADRVDLGRGDDYVAVRTSGVAPGGALVGGPGDDSLGVDDTFEPGVLEIDTGARTIERDGAVVPGWRSFEEWTASATEGAIRFTGTDAAEAFRGYAPDGGVDVVMGGGADRFEVYPDNPGTAFGGAGRDLLVVRSGEVRVDLAAGTVSGAGVPRISVSGFNDAAVLGSDAVLLGDDADNRLVAGCGRIVGRGGDDVLRQNTVLLDRGEQPHECFDGHVALGGPGADVLVGSWGADRLVGGTGRDRADGSRGRDQCRAETLVSCER